MILNKIQFSRSRELLANSSISLVQNPFPSVSRSGVSPCGGLGTVYEGTLKK
jgi:hypothetical protein